MRASVIDVLIFAPLILLIPIVATWWLPWERWLPAKVPKALLGPYLLYVAFAIWHFKLAWWAVLSVALMGTVFSILALIEITKKPQQ